MTADSAAITATFKVGRYVCTLSAPEPTPGSVLSMCAEWTPEVPDRLTGLELRQYRRGRDAFVAKIAERVGGKALIVEAA